MKALSLREIQLEELKILKTLTFFFAKHDIHYILCGGSMLGAVRHEGFIPWDDDIDILVPRDDYEKLKVLYKNEKAGLEGIKLTLPGDKGSPHSFIKAINTDYIVKEKTRNEEYQAYLWVDVFPMDHFPDDEKTHRKYLRKISTLVKILSSNTITKEYLISRGYYSNVVKRVKLLVSQCAYHILGGSQKIALRIDRVARDMDTKFKSSDHVGDGAWPNGMKDYFPMRAVEPVMLHDFEDTQFYIPENYDEYLTLFYGDYMRIPPVEERQDHHIEVYQVEE
ncbi:MAG: LicD family protein [Lachnospiraceae bacterium]|nr:LicD family protein [Lachnospiraceae bacterium]